MWRRPGAGTYARSSSSTTARSTARRTSRTKRAPRSSCGTRRRARRPTPWTSGGGGLRSEAVLFVDADCTDLTAAHLDAICKPFVEGRAVLSLGAFDYGRFWNQLVLRSPAADRRADHPRMGVGGDPRPKLDGYTIEMRINEVVAERRLPTWPGRWRRVHRTNATSTVAGRGAALVRMYRALITMVWPFGDVRVRTYWCYLRGLTVEGQTEADDVGAAVAELFAHARRRSPPSARRRRPTSRCRRRRG